STKYYMSLRRPASRCSGLVVKLAVAPLSTAEAPGAADGFAAGQSLQAEAKLVGQRPGLVELPLLPDAGAVIAQALLREGRDLPRHGFGRLDQGALGDHPVGKSEL